jgi:peptidoglycan/xylan/chitin deacetylase (PgdA/CDA1 family)
MMKKLVLSVATVIVIMVSGGLFVNVSSADTASHGVISLTFDDGWQSQYSNAFPLLQARGMLGTFYVITGYLSNNQTGSTYMTFPELQTMQNAGNEIGSHSVAHPDLTSVSDAQISYECSQSKLILNSYNLTVNNFAYPFGSYNAQTDSIVSQYYRTARDVYCSGYVLQLPYSQWHLPATTGDAGDPGVLSTLEAIVDKVYSTNEWAVIYFHQILPNVPNTADIINLQTFTTFLDYVKNKGVPTLTVNQTLNLGLPAGPPGITISPTSLKMDVGQTKLFSSSINPGNPPYSYQWYLNGAAVLNATAGTWTFAPSTAGNYEVFLNVTDALRYQVKSNIVADITVYPQMSVSINPLSVNMSTLAIQTFTSTVSGGYPPYSYNWFLNGTAMATGPSYAFTWTAVGTCNLMLNVTDSAGITVSSNTSTVRVEAPLNAPVTPTHVGIDVGQSQTFSSTVTGGTTPYAYQWVLNDSAVTGANGAIWVFSPSTPGQYTVYLNITDSLNVKIQSPVVANITVYPQLTISISPGSTNMAVGGSQQFSSSITGGLAPYSYQWYYSNGTAVPDSTTSSLTFNPTSTGSFSIYLKITDNLNSQVQSNVATINVASSPTPTPSSSLLPTIAPSPSASPTLIPVTPQPTPTIDSLSTPSSSGSTNSPGTNSSNISGYYAIGVVVLVIVLVLVGTDVLLVKHRLSHPPPPPPPEEE